MKRKRVSKEDLLVKLYDCIEHYAAAQIAASWKGSADPADHEAIDLRVELAWTELSAHIEKVKREL